MNSINTKSNLKRFCEKCGCKCRNKIVNKCYKCIKNQCVNCEKNKSFITIRGDKYCFNCCVDERYSIL